MKKWFSRLVGAEEGSGNAVDGAGVQSGACIASAALEDQILEQVRALAARTRGHSQVIAQTRSGQVPGSSEFGVNLLACSRQLSAGIARLLDACILSEDDTLVSEGLDNFQHRCLGKLSNLED